MKKKSRKNAVAARIILCVLTFVFAGLLAFSLYAQFASDNNELAYIRSETLYIVVACALLLPVLIALLLILIIVDKKKGKSEEIEIEMPPEYAAASLPTQAVQSVPAVQPKQDKKQSDGTNRFCMLTDI